MRGAVLAMLILTATLQAADLPVSEFQSRRAAAMRRVADGILLVHSRGFTFHSDQDYLAGFQQDPDFFYLTGLPSAAGAVLAIDGAAKETWLFVPDELPGIAGLLKNLRVEPGAATEKALGLDHVVDRNELAAFLIRREAATPPLLLYASGAGKHTAPLAAALDDPAMAWSHAISEIWPIPRIRDARPLLAEMRLTKSPAEIEALRGVGQSSASALRAGLASLSPGRPQREAEASVVS
ncbi:MAG TPA: aminopeptidase P N-terminal domain-containing protein, partial [Thermoanaerobaculia bacterium]